MDGEAADGAGEGGQSGRATPRTPPTRTPVSTSGAQSEGSPAEQLAADSMGSLQQAIAAGLSFGRFEKPSPGVDEDADSFDEASVCDLEPTRLSLSKHRLSQPSPSRRTCHEFPRDLPLPVLGAIEALAAHERYVY